MKTVELPARDGFKLAARVHQASDSPAASSRPRVCVIHSATAVPQRYYGPFAEALARRGVTAVTYDYRGIGDSRPADLPFAKFAATMFDWIRLDADGVHDWIAREFPGAELTVVGHSFGGQMLGLLENRAQIARALLVSAQNGYWRLFRKRDQPLMIFYWYLAFPFFLATLGYVPMKKLAAGEDLPGGVARQWRAWCMHKDYIFSQLTPAERQGYKNLPAKILAYSFSDDSYSGHRAVESLLSFYASEKITLRKLDPADAGVKQIGHFGFFKPGFEESLWSEALAWLAPAAGT